MYLKTFFTSRHEKLYVKTSNNIGAKIKSRPFTTEMAQMLHIIIYVHIIMCYVKT